MSLPNDSSPMSNAAERTCDLAFSSSLVGVSWHLGQGSVAYDLNSPHPIQTDLVLVMTEG